MYVMYINSIIVQTSTYYLYIILYILLIYRSVWSFMKHYELMVNCDVTFLFSAEQNVDNKLPDALHKCVMHTILSY